jgi:hypothetical protein
VTGYSEPPPISHCSSYLFLGQVRYLSHESEKPMRIMWKLDAEMPLDFFSEVKIAAG